MIRQAKTACIVLLTVAALPAGGCRSNYTTPTVTIAGKTWQVEVAATAEQRWQGLSGRADLSENAGMLFVFPEAGDLAFCMRGCLIPLDIAFIGPEMRVVGIHTMLVEGDLAGRKVYASPAPAMYALEVPAGALTRAGVTVGAAVTFAGDIPDLSRHSPSKPWRRRAKADAAKAAPHR